MGNKDVKMAHASLFSGIGGAELAASWMGWDNKFHCEINPFCRKILEYHFPESISYEDISKTDFSDWRGQIDVLTGGFPCQPFSLAGKRKGAEDNRYLWLQMLRAIREIRPTWVVGENVAGILTMVQPGEEAEVGSTGDIFEENYIYRTEQRFTIDEICEGLEREGYSVQPVVIPACAVGAPHRRDRVWIVARRIAADTSRNGDRGRPGAVREEVGRQDYELRAEPFEHGGLQTMAATDTDEHRHTPCRESGRTETKREERFALPGEREVWSQRSDRFPGLPRDAANADSDKLQRECFSREAKEKRWKDENRRFEEYSGNDRATLPADRWKNFPTQPPIRSRYDGLSTRLDGITFSKWRQESIKAYGNAWVPQVAYEIFMAIGNVMECK